MTDQINACEAEKASIIQVAQDLADTLNGQITVLEGEKSTLETEKAGLEVIVSGLETDNDILESERDGLIIEVESKSSQITDL